MEMKLCRVSLGCQSRPSPGRLQHVLEAHVHALTGHRPPCIVTEHQVVLAQVVRAEP